MTSSVAEIQNIPTSSQLESIAREASRLTLEYFRKKPKFSEKSDNQGIVTQADLESERLITEFITKNFPGHVLVAEESFDLDAKEGLLARSLAQGAKPQPVWIVDPIDGTTNFSKGNPYYCVSIGFGVVESGRCRMIAGVIAHPVSGDIYLARAGEGATCNGQPLRVSPLTDIHLASVATGFSSNKGKDLERVVDCIRRTQERILGTRLQGAAALDLALTARGILDGFYEARLLPWDVAAGSLLVREAGGLATNYEGQEFDPLKDKNLICGNPTIHGFLHGNLKDVYAGQWP